MFPAVTRVPRSHPIRKRRGPKRRNPIPLASQSNSLLQLLLYQRTFCSVSSHSLATLPPTTSSTSNTSSSLYYSALTRTVSPHGSPTHRTSQRTLASPPSWPRLGAAGPSASDHPLQLPDPPPQQLVLALRLLQLLPVVRHLLVPGCRDDRARPALPRRRVAGLRRARRLGRGGVAVVLVLVLVRDAGGGGAERDAGREGGRAVVGGADAAAADARGAAVAAGRRGVRGAHEGARVRGRRVRGVEEQAWGARGVGGGGRGDGGRVRAQGAEFARQAVDLERGC
jgi:hypothetical protein